ARQEAERTQNLLELTTNHVPTSIAYLDRDKNYIFANATYEQWFGKKPQSLTGRPVSDILTPVQLKEREAHMDAALTGRKVTFESKVNTSLGKNRCHAITYTPDITPAGQVRGFVVMAQDITEQKEREAQLKWSEERFRQLTDNLPSHVFYVKERDPHRVIYVSPAYEKLWGATATSLYANPLGFLNSVHPDDRAKLLGAAEDEGRGAISTVEYRLVQPDGSVRWILDRSFPIYNQAGEAYRTAGIAADVTERKLAEIEKQRLLDSERRARELANLHRAKLFALFMQAPGAVSIASGPELRYELANETYTRMTGKGALVGRTVAEVYEGLDPKIMDIIRRV
ncbi:MAG: PAS domain S-box protein, partial [Proteobacteria bacterium]